MSFRDTYGKNEVNPGRWHTMQRDNEREVDVDFRIRPLNQDLQNEYDQRFGRETTNPITGMEQYVIPAEANDQATKLMACDLWTDTLNAWVHVVTKDAAELYGSELGVELRAGDEVCLDGKLTQAIKWNLLKDDFPLANRITMLARSVAQKTEKKKAALRKNSQASSRATSSGSTPTSSAPGVESSEEARIPASQTPT